MLGGWEGGRERNREREREGMDRDGEKQREGMDRDGEKQRERGGDRKRERVGVGERRRGRYRCVCVWEGGRWRETARKVGRERKTGGVTERERENPKKYSTRLVV